MASPIPSLKGMKSKHGWEGETTPSHAEEDEKAQNISPLIGHSPGSHQPRSFWQRWSPHRRSPKGNPASLGSVLQSLVPTCNSPAIPRPPLLSRGRRRQRVTGTLFGLRKGRVTFAVQTKPEEEPGLLLELAFPTSFLADEMAAGVVRILLECEKQHIGNDGNARMVSLWDEPVWTMYSNGRQCGFAVSRPFGEEDRRVFRSVGAVTAGAGVLPASPVPGNDHDPSDTAKIAYGGEEGCALDVMFIRARFERVVRKNSEAFHMANPGGRGGGGSELSIFLLRV